MLRSILTVAFRKLWRDKVYVTINVIGLSLGIAACILIWLIAHHEFTFDTFHANADRIYRLVTYEKYTDDTPEQLIPAVVPPLPGILASRAPGIGTWAPYHVLPEIKVSVSQHGGHKDFLNSATIITNASY